MSDHSGSTAENASLEADLAANLDEDKLIRLAREDLAQFRPLYERWLPPVYRYFYHRVGNSQDAEELTAQVFLAVCEKLPAYRHRGHFAAWLFSIARRRAADYFRKRDPSVPLEIIDPADPAPNPLVQAINSDEIQRLRGIIQSLPERDQELIRLRYVAQLTFGAIARLFNRKEDSVRKQLSRLLVRMQNQMEDKYEGAGSINPG